MSAIADYIEGVKEKMEFKAREQQVSGQCTEFALKFGKFYMLYPEHPRKQ